MPTIIYVYAEDRSDQEFLSEIENQIAGNVSDYGPGELNVVSIQVDDEATTPGTKADLDGYMVSRGFAYLGTSPTIIQGVHHWGSSIASEQPTLSIEGDIWFDRTTDRLATYSRGFGGTLVWEPIPHLHQGGVDLDGYVRSPYGGLGLYQNLLRFSEEFDISGVWTLPGAIASVTRNNAVAPNGETVADTLTWTAAGVGFRQNNVGVANGQTYTVTVWARVVSGTAPELTFSAGGGTQSAAIAITSTFFRYTETFVAGNSGDYFDIHHSGTDGVFEVWGIQLVDGVNDYPYTRTRGTPVITVRSGAVIDGYVEVTDGLRLRDRGSLTLPDGTTLGTASPPNPSGWHITTVEMESVLALGGQDTAPTGVFIDPSGTYLFIAGDLNNSVYRYSLSTRWDVTSASFDNSYALPNISTTRSLFMSPDGLLLFVVGATTNFVQSHRLATPWDLTSVTGHTSFDVTSQDTDPSSAFFDPTGLYWYLVGGQNASVYRYQMTRAWDISTSTLVSSFSLAPFTATPTGLSFSPEGSRMFVTRATGLVFEFALPSPWDITSAVDTEHRYNADLDGNTYSLFFRPDGSNMYIIEDVGSLRQFRVGLETSWMRADTVTADCLMTLGQTAAVGFGDGTTQGTGSPPFGYGYSVETLRAAGQTFDLSSNDTSPFGLAMHPEGTLLFVVGNQNDLIYKYELSTPWDISTCVLRQTRATTDSLPHSIAFRPDGLRYYILGQSTDSILSFDLDVPWDLTNVTSSGSFSILLFDTQGTDMAFSPDGRRLLVTGNQNDIIIQIDLEVPWDLGNATIADALDISSLTSAPDAIAVRPDGRRFYFFGGDVDTIFEFEMVTPWSVTDAYLVRQQVQSLALGLKGLVFKPDGTFAIGVDSALDALVDFTFGLQTTELNTDVILANSLLVGRKEFTTTTDTATLGAAHIYACTDTSAVRTLTLSTSTLNLGTPSHPLAIVVKDESGNAGTNAITVDTQSTALIDGESSIDITADHGVLSIYSDGSNWFSS